jgi:hypothetical protein
MYYETNKIDSKKLFECTCKKCKQDFKSTDPTDQTDSLCVICSDDLNP